MLLEALYRRMSIREGHVILQNNGHNGGTVWVSLCLLDTCTCVL